MRPGDPSPKHVQEPHLEIPERGDLASHLVGHLRPVAPGKPQVYVVDLGAGPMVIKDAAFSGIWARWWDRFTIRREIKAYIALGQVPFAPAFIGVVDRDAFAAELVCAEQLALSPARRAHGPQLFERLEELVAELEARGLINLDLRGRRNLLIRPNGELTLIDLGGGVYLPPGTLRNRLFMPVLHLVHRSAMLKWKAVLVPDQLSTGNLRAAGWLRWLWPWKWSRPIRVAVRQRARSTRQKDH